MLSSTETPAIYFDTIQVVCGAWMGSAYQSLGLSEKLVDSASQATPAVEKTAEPAQQWSRALANQVASTLRWQSFVSWNEV
jgi:hypothetical protein